MKKYILFGFFVFLTSCNLGIQPPTPEITFVETQTSLPTPLLVTATETLVLPSTSTDTPTPPPLYFIDEFTSASSYWVFSQTGGPNLPTTTFENDTLRIDISSPDTWLIGTHNTHTYNNVFITAKANITSTGSYGLICRYGNNGWYEFNIYSDGTYNLLYGKQLTEGVAKYIPLSTEFSGHIAPSSEIGLHCQDNFLLLYVNSNLLKRVDVTNYGLGEGQIGITASSVTDSPVSIIFEWVQISEQ